MNSVSLMKAGVKSRLADYLEYEPDSDQTAVMGVRPIGGVTISQIDVGTDYPTVQGAIDDLKYRTEIPVNGLFITSDGIPPSPVAQADQFKLTGAVPGASTEEHTLIFLGIPVKVLGGDQPTAVATKIKTALDEYVLRYEYFNSVEVSASSGDTLVITYNDCQNHVFGAGFSKGITYTQTIVSPAKSGYGVWENQGSTSVSLVGGVGGDKSITVYYFKRIA